MFELVSLVFAALISESVLFDLEGLLAAGRALFWQLLVISMLVCATIVRTGGKPRVSIIYARYSTDMQNPLSCEDQVRIVREALTRKGIDSTGFLVLTDDAESGRIVARDNFSQILEMMARQELAFLAVDDQARFSRAINASQFITDLVYFGCRFYSVVENVDTNEDGWQLKVKVVEVHNTLSSAELAHRVRRGLSSRVVRGCSAGDLPFGYESFFLDPAYAAAYRGIGPKPPRGVRVNEDMARWVRQIFAWFIAGWSVSAIARELTHLKVPKGIRGRTTKWYPSYVTQVLSNAKYVGVWKWGQSTTIRSSEGDKKQVPTKAGYTTVVERPDLQIVDRETWEKAQRRFKEIADKNAPKPGHKRRGRKPGSSTAPSAGLLHGLVFCAKCGSPLRPTSCHGVQYLACPNRLRVEDPCPMYTHLHVANGEEALLALVAELFSTWPEWMERSVTAMRHTIDQAASALPKSLAADQKRLAALRDDIEAFFNAFLKDSSVESRSAKAQLQSMDAEVLTIEQRIEATKRAAAVPGKMPDDAWIVAQLRGMNDLIREGGERAASVLCKLLGKVNADQVIAPGKRRGYIQLHISLSGHRALAHLLDGRIPGVFLIQQEGQDGTTAEIQLNIGRQSRLDELGAQIARMREQKVPWKEIYEATGLESGPAYLAWRRYRYARKLADDQAGQVEPSPPEDQEEAA